MTIKHNSGPADGVSTLHTALEKRVRRMSFASGAPAGGGTADTGSPLPVFHLGMDYATHPDALQFARQTEWRYPVIGPNALGFATISEAAGAPQYCGITYGMFAQRLFDACQIADKTFGNNAAEEYEARILDVPGLNVVALWLAGETNHFIPLLEGNPPGTTSLQILNDIKPFLRAAASKRSEFAAPASTVVAEHLVRSTPTN